MNIDFSVYKYKVPDPNVEGSILIVNSDGTTNIATYDNTSQVWKRDLGGGNYCTHKLHLFEEGLFNWIYKKDFMRIMNQYRNTLIIEEV